MSNRYPLVPIDHPALRSVAEYIPSVDEAFDAAAKMILACKRYAGVGLAAPQIGLSWRLIVVSAIPDRCCFDSWIVLVDPVIAQARGRVESEEGCLSLAGLRVTVPRSTSVTVDSLVLQWGHKPISPTPVRRSINRFDGLSAIILQHEMDHLAGVLIDKYLAARQPTSNPGGGA